MLTPGADAMISLVADQTRREHVKLMEKTKKGSGTTDLTVGRPLPQILKFALPLVLGTLFQQLYSFADIYSAIEGNDGNIANAANTEAVNRLNEIFTKGRIIYVMAEGLATSQDNYIGEDSENVGLERNKTLAYNRAYTVVNWLKGNEKFRNVSNNVFAVNALVNPIVKVDDKSVQGLNSKLGRCVKVRIHFVIDK